MVLKGPDASSVRRTEHHGNAQSSLGAPAYSGSVALNLMKAKIAELVLRINEIVRVGNFKMDMDMGIICYKTSVLIGKTSVDCQIIENLLFANWYLADEFFPAFVDVLFRNSSPQRAIAAIFRPNASCDGTEDKKGSQQFRRNLGDIAGESLN